MAFRSIPGDGPQDLNSLLLWFDEKQSKIAEAMDAFDAVDSAQPRMVAIRTSFKLRSAMTAHRSKLRGRASRPIVGLVDALHLGGHVRVEAHAVFSVLALHYPHLFLGF